MRILITGYTSRMCSSMYLRNDYVTFSNILPRILREMGHEVTHKKYAIGEPLIGQYDFAFVGVAPLSSITSGRVCESHYVLETMRNHCAIFADDWSFCGFGESVRYTLDRWEKYLKYKRFPYDSKILEETKKSLMQLIYFEKEMNPPVLAPMFPWGNHGYLMSENFHAKLFAIDPSPYVTYPDIKVPRPQNKKRQWVMAALSNHMPWVKRQKFKLPVLYIGNNKLGETFCENQTIQIFAESFGVLSTGYPSAGSGWWRTRYLNASWAESLIYSDPRDAAEMGPAFQGIPDRFESITSEAEYLELFDKQKSWLSTHISTKKLVEMTLERLLN